MKSEAKITKGIFFGKYNNCLFKRKERKNRTNFLRREKYEYITYLNIKHMRSKHGLINKNSSKPISHDENCLFKNNKKRKIKFLVCYFYL